MRILSTIFFYLVLSLSLSAQINCFIEGPRELECPPVTAEYFLFCETDEYEILDWNIDRPWDVDMVEDTAFLIVTYFVGGEYIISAVVASPNEIDTVEINVWVGEGFGEIRLDGCSEDFNDCEHVCVGSTMRFENSNSVGNGSWMVTGDAEVRDFGWYIEVDWTTPGNVTVGYDDYCFVESICIQVMDEPIADFLLDGQSYSDGDTVEVCRFQEIDLKNISTNGLDYSWGFGDGNSSEDSELQYRYELPGVYELRMTANGVCECSDEKCVFVKVDNAASPTLSCVNSVCPETRQRYTAVTDGCTVFDWTVSSNGTVIDGGESSDDFIEVIWHSGPDGFIDLAVSSCASVYCSSSNRFRVPIISPDGPISGDASVCSGELSIYSAPYFPGTSYNWSLSANGTIVENDGGNSIVVLWNDVNAVSSARIDVVYDNCFLECGGDASFDVQITPNMFIEAAPYVCQGDDATASALAGFSVPAPVMARWELQDDQGAVVFSSSTASTATFNFSIPLGNYYWVAIHESDDVCNEIARKLVEVSEVPTEPLAITGEENICPGIPYGYTITRSGEYGTAWEVIDGANTFTYSGQSITHAFGPDAPYEVNAYHVNLQYTDCRSAAIGLTVTGGVAGEITTSGDTVCLESIESYSVELIGASDYQWRVIPDDMGELLQNNTNEIDIFWTKSGTATLRLETCAGAIDKEITVRDLPSFTILGNFSSCGNERETISTDQPSLTHRWIDAAGTIVSNNTSADLLPGYYRVLVTDAFGCSSQQSFQIEELPYPEVSLTSPDAYVTCADIVNGVRLVANTDGIDYSFEWFFNGSSVGTGPRYLATDVGEYQVVATNEFGCSSSSLPATLGGCCPIDSCVVDADPGLGCPLRLYDFDVDIEELTCETKRYTIQEPDYVPGTGRWVVRTISQGAISVVIGDELNYSYDLPGYYQIVFTGKLAGFPYEDPACTHYWIFTDSVRMVSDFLGVTACAGEDIEFNDLSTFIPSESIISWSWDFDDPASGVNNTSSDQNPTHAFTAGGTFDVSLSITAASGCTSTHTESIFVSDGPDLTIAHRAEGCEEVGVLFEIDDSVLDIAWDFGDPTSSENTAMSAAVIHSYDDDGQYTISVSGDDIYGCRGTNTTTIDIMANLLAGDIDVQPSDVLCQGDTATLTSPLGATSWQWSNGESTEAIDVTQSDNYSVFIEDAFGCSFTTDAVFITVNPTPLILAKARRIYIDEDPGPWQDRLMLCEGDLFELQVFSDVALNYLWSTGSTNHEIIFDGHVNPLPDDGVTEYWVVGIDPDTGCPSDTSYVEVEVIANPAVPNIRLASGSACSFDANILAVTNVDPSLEYVWSNGATGTSIEVTAAGTYTVEAFNANGCSSISNELNIRPSAPVDRLPGGCFDLCDPHTLCLPALAGVASYEIFRDGISIETGTTFPDDFLIDQDGSYHFEITTTNGCVAESDPLDVTLYTGVGVVTVEVLDDVDGDGAVSGTDTAVAGITVVIESSTDVQMGSTETEEDGQFDFVDFPADDYLALIDRGELHPRWKVVIDSQAAQLVGCDDSVSVTLLIMENCRVQGPDVELYACEGDTVAFGDSSWIAPGVFEHHYLSSLGCDSVVMVNIVPDDSVNIRVRIWEDADGDGVVSGGDIAVGNIDWILENTDSGTESNESTDASGQSDVIAERGNYLIHLDHDVSSGFQSIIDSLTLDATACGPVEIDLLLAPGCAAVTVTESAQICNGDSIVRAGMAFFESGNYTVLLSDSTSGCDTTLMLSLMVGSPIDISAEIENSCDSATAGASISLTVTGDGPFDFIWDPEADNSPMIEGLSEGTYGVTVIDSSGCSQFAQYVIDPLGDLEFGIAGLFTVEEGEVIELPILGDTDESGVVVTWTPATGLSCTDCFTPVADLDSTQSYEIMITDSNGCLYLLETKVVVLPSRNIFAPNVFTPNADGVNDHFALAAKDPGAIIEEFSIYNRWGAEVFREANVAVAQMKGWNGMQSGRESASQVFVYKAKVRLSDGEVEMVAGDVTLLR